MAIALTLTSLWISLADFRRTRIPTAATVVLALCAIATLLLTKSPLLPHLLAALATGAAFWFLAEAFYRLRAYEGLGLGDVKLAAAGALWVGPFGVPSMVLLAALSGLATAILTQSRVIPFGPHLCLGLWITFVIGPVI